MANKYDKYSMADAPGRNLGGICKVEIANKKWIDLIPETSLEDGTIKFPIQFIDDYDFIPLPLASTPLGYKEDDVFSQSGTYYKQTIRGRIKRDTYDRLCTIKNLAMHEWVVRFTDRNGHVRIVGSKAKAMRFNSSFGTGESAEGSALYDITLYCESPCPAPHYLV